MCCQGWAGSVLRHVSPGLEAGNCVLPGGAGPDRGRARPGPALCCTAQFPTAWPGPAGHGTEPARPSPCSTQFPGGFCYTVQVPTMQLRIVCYRARPAPAAFSSWLHGWDCRREDGASSAQPGSTQFLTGSCFIMQVLAMQLETVCCQAGTALAASGSWLHGWDHRVQHGASLAWSGSMRIPAVWLGPTRHSRS